jgi:RNA polymerase sigma-70 factor (ECF subfamily)
MEKRTEDIFNEIYDAAAKKTLCYITAKCGSLSDIQDIFQETYTELYSVLCRKGADYVREPEAFVMRLAKVELHRHYTLAERMKIVFFSRAEDGEDEGTSVELADTGELSPEDAAEVEAAVSAVREYLRRKDDETRRIFYLHYYMDMTLRQIAEAMEVSESKVKHRLYGTLRELRELFADK